MELLNMLGLDLPLFLFQVFNFLLIAWLLKKFLYKPVQNALNERKNKIDKGLKDAEDAGLALENAAKERQKILSAAKSDADAMASSAKAALEETKAKMTAEAKNRSQQIIDEARKKAEMEFDNINKQIGKMSVDISGKVMSHAFSGLFTEEEKKEILARAIAKIEKGIYEKSSH